VNWVDENSEEGDSVYQLSVQFFPLSKGSS
jgi:hypothetical protein